MTRDQIDDGQHLLRAASTDATPGDPGIAEGETTSEEIAARVFAVLSQSPDEISTFACSLPPPIVETDYITCR